VIGLTGGTATGKSHLAGLFRRAGAAYYSVDEAAHALYAPGQPAARAIARVFGRSILLPGGGVNRAGLAAVVSRDPGALRRLESILHPRLGRTARAAVVRLRRRHVVTVVEAGPLLFSLGLHRVCDRAILVRCPRRVRVARLRAARGWSRAEAERRLRLFAPAERRLARQAGAFARLVRLDGSLAPGRLAVRAGRMLAAAGA
jgi:dephospho-CoA kinase